MSYIATTVWKRFGVKIDCTADGWQTDLMTRLSSEQLREFLPLLGHEPELIRLAGEQLLALDPTEDQLVSLVHAFGCIENRNEAARRLLEMNPTPEQLGDVLLFSRVPETKRRAAELILRADAPNAALESVILHSDDDALVGEATRKWDEADPNGDVVSLLRYCTNDAVAVHFWDLFIRREETTTTNVTYVMCFSEVQAIKDRAAEALMDREPNLDELSYVVNQCSIDAVIVEATDRLLARKAADSFHLLGIVEKHPSREMRNRIAERLLGYKPKSRWHKKLGAETSYAHILCHCDDAAICETAWRLLSEYERFSESTFEFVAESATLDVYRRAARERLDRAAREARDSDAEL